MSKGFPKISTKKITPTEFCWVEKNKKKQKLVEVGSKQL